MAADIPAASSSGPRGGNTNPSDEGIYTTFIDTVKEDGLTNPYGLAAVASTAKHESGYSAKNTYGNWRGHLSLAGN